MNGIMQKFIRSEALRRASVRTSSRVSGSQLLETKLSSRSCLFTANVPLCEMSGVRFSSSAKNQGGSAISIGDRVQVHISGRLSDGREFGQSKEDNPISFIVGSGEVIPGIEEALVGLRKGTTTNIEIAPTKAFGKEKRVYSIPRKELRLRPEDEEMLDVGKTLVLNGGEQARVVKVTEESIDVDLSHPLAGENLYVDLNIVDHVLHENLSPAERLVLPVIVTPGDNMNFPQRGDTLLMHYVGKLTDGTVFDSSRERGTPFQFVIGVGHVIKGWDEGVMRMCKGQKAILNIPSAKGYGKAGAGGVIPPDADLIFEVELLDIKQKDIV